MERERKFKIVALVAVIIAVIGLSIAFAAMSRTLNINGRGNVDPANFDIYFTNLSQPTLKGEASVSGTPTLATKGVTISNMNVTLKKPNDSVVYTVDIKNDGDIDAEIENLVLPTFTSAQQELFDFTVVYTNGGQAVSIGDTLAKGETKNVTITFKYKDITDESLLPSTAQQISLSYQIIYKQTNNVVTTESGSIDQVSDCTPFTKKDTYAVGDLISVCNNTTGKSEDFYVISDNGTTVTVLSKYNLLVGNTATVDYSSGQPVSTSVTPIPTNTPDYGLQNETAKGLDINSTTYVGTIKFSDTDYFDGEDGHLAPQYDENTSYVFDSNSTIWPILQSYKTYIENLNKTVTSVLLMSAEQAEALSQASNAESILFSSSYWLGIRGDNDSIGAIYMSQAGPMPYNSDWMVGVRPVITINKSDL